MKWSLIIAVILFIGCNNKPTNNNESNSNAAVSNNDTSAIVANKVNNDSNNINPGETVVNKIIIPGERIGKAVLNTDADSLEQLFGKPDLSDAAMGKAWLTWYGKKNDEHNNKTELDIYTSYKDTSMRGKSVQQIRTTSAYFITQNNIHVYSSLDEIRKVFPQIQQVQQSKEDAKKFTAYDDVKNGIAFEIVTANNQHICAAILCSS